MNIKVEIVNQQNEKTFLVDGIPPEIWNSFVQRAPQLRPDIANPALAWAALLGDVIESLANVEKKVIMLRDIPPKEFDAIAKKCEEAGTNIAYMISDLITAASRNRLYYGRYAVPRDGKIVKGTHIILLSGITDKAMEPFMRLYEATKMSIIMIFGKLFKGIESGDIKVSAWKDDTIKTGAVGEFSKEEIPEVG